LPDLGGIPFATGAAGLGRFQRSPLPRSTTLFPTAESQSHTWEKVNIWIDAVYICGLSSEIYVLVFHHPM
jgi:hypothetical protein